jgi:hypothetical protein
MKQLNFVLATDSKIVSINSLYGAKIGYKAGRPFPQLYRSQAAMRFEREVRDQLLALRLDQEWVEWFKTTKHFSMTVNFILRTGISRRDVSNCDKALIDTITRFIKFDLGCEDFDDSLFSDVHFYKSTIPQGSKEYCCVQITESTHEMRFDVIPKPERLWFWEGCMKKPDLPKVPKRKKKGEIYLEEVQNKQEANTYMYILDSSTALTPELFFKLSEDKTNVLRRSSGFLYIGLLDLENWADENKKLLEFLINEFNEANKQYSGIKLEVLEDINESMIWLQK